MDECPAQIRTKGRPRSREFGNNVYSPLDRSGEGSAQPCVLAIVPANGAEKVLFRLGMKRSGKGHAG
jgi:hypothetical protein